MKKERKKERNKERKKERKNERKKNEINKEHIMYKNKERQHSLKLSSWGPSLGLLHSAAPWRAP